MVASDALSTEICIGRHNALLRIGVDLLACASGVDEGASSGFFVALCVER